MEERYKEVSLNKIKLIPISQDLEFIPQTPESYKVYGYESKYIGRFHNLEEAKKALEKHIETEPEVIAYEITGREHGYGEPDLNIDWDNVSIEEEEDVVADESPEFYFLYDKHKNLNTSYFYDIDNPGGNRLDGEKVFNNGESAYVRVSLYIGDNHYDLLIPINIEGKITKEYLEDKWRNVIKGKNKYFYGVSGNEEPSEKSIQFEIDRLLNIERDSLIFKPLVTVKCNWGEEPHTPFDDAPRIDFFQSSLFK